MNTRLRFQPTVIATATLTAAVLGLTGCSGDDGDAPEFTEQPRTADAASASGTMSVDPSESETEDAGQWLGDGDSVNVGWVSARTRGFDEGYVYDVALSNPRVFSETGESAGQAVACVDMTGTNHQQYEREVFSSGRYNIEIKGNTADHLTPAPATPEDVAKITAQFAVMGDGPSATVGEARTTEGDAPLKGPGFRPLGTDSMDAYNADIPDNTAGEEDQKFLADPEIVETTGDGGYKVSLCYSLGEHVSATPDSLTVSLGNRLETDRPGEGFHADTRAFGWKFDL